MKETREAEAFLRGGPVVSQVTSHVQRLIVRNTTRLILFALHRDFKSDQSGSRDVLCKNDFIPYHSHGFKHTSVTYQDFLSVLAVAYRPESSIQRASKQSFPPSILVSNIYTDKPISFSHAPAISRTSIVVNMSLLEEMATTLMLKQCQFGVHTKSYNNFLEVGFAVKAEASCWHEN